MENKNKEIQYLEDYEHILLRPTVYIGSVEPSEETLPIYQDGKIIQKKYTISVGFYKLFNEILDNAFDEARRRNGKMKKIEVDIYSKSGMVVISDTGNGFTNPNDINPKTKLTNVETAFTKFSSGTNFENQTEENSLIGVNGMGGALTNLFSESFEVMTCDGKKKYLQKWERFKSTKKIYTDSRCKGTTITFTLRKDIFQECCWEKDIIYTLLLFKNYLKKKDNIISNLEFTVKYDNVSLDIDKEFFTEGSIYVETKIGGLIISENYENSTNVGYVNMAICEGIHQQIINEFINDVFKDSNADTFYNTFLFLNLEPKYVLFGNQNKTIFKTRKNIIEPILNENFQKKIKLKLSNSVLYNNVIQKIEEKKLGITVKKLDKIKSSKIILSSKYFPSSKKKDMLFLVEGDSACGSLNQMRDITTMSSYALKGKINNVKDVKDILKSNELSELIKILGLDIKGNQLPKYDKIVIAADSDVDGMHVSSLILNFFYTWFPSVIQHGKLYQLNTPIIKAETNKLSYYFYSIEEYEKEKNTKNFKKYNYFKGLGSLEKEDWKYVFGQLNLRKFVIDEHATESIEMAFRSKDQKKKKLWINSN